MSKPAIEFYGIVGKPRILADGSLRIDITTPREMTDHEILSFLKIKDTHVDAYLKPRDDEIDELLTVGGE